MTSAIVPPVDDLEPYLDSLLEELGDKTGSENSAASFFSVGTQTDIVVTQIKEEEWKVTEHNIVKIDDDIGQFQEPDLERLDLPSKSFYLKDHLNLMCTFALCRIEGNSGTQNSICHLGTVILVAVLALIQAWGMFKDFVLGFAKGGNVFHYITAWYYFHTIVVICCFLKIVFHGEKILIMTKNIEKLLKQKNVEAAEQQQPSHKLVISMAVLTVILSSTLALGLEIFVVNYSLKQIVEVRAYEFSRTLLLWEKANYSDHAADLMATYGDFNWLSITLSFAEITMQFAGKLQYYMIKDIMLMAALTLYSYAEVYKVYLKSIDKLDLPLLGAMWRNYELLHKISAEIETCFGDLFQLIHIDNWLFCAYFLYGYVDFAEIEPIYFVINLVEVTKVAVTYSLSAKANNATSQTRRKLHMKSSHIGREEESSLKQDILYMEQKMKISPVGIGSGNLLVHENFPYKFVGSVASSFLFFLKSEDD